jgi:hypothetical protein
VPKRSSLHDRLDQDAQGAEAVYGQPSTVDRQRSTVSAPNLPDRWEAAHQRVTFYCPRELLDQVEVEVARSGRSKSRVIVDALRDHLGGQAEAR